MKITPIEHKFGKPKPYPISFGYHNQLKTLFIKGKIKPKYGIYGDKINRGNVSLEHIRPISQGGKTELENLALASKLMNNIRGNKPLNEFLNTEGLVKYCEYFLNIKLPEFDGAKYVKGLLNTINKVLEKEI